MSKKQDYSLGTGSVPALLWAYSLPAIAAMIITSVSNIVSSIFIGHGIGVLALSAMAVTFPLMNLVIAVCFLVGAGGAAISSIYLGKKDPASANKALAHVLLLNTFNAVLFGIICLIWLDPILLLFGASQETLPYAREYMIVVLLTMPVSFIMLGLNSMLRALGFPQKAMWSALLSVAVTIVLTPIFIFWLGWGMWGAALASVLSHGCSLVWVVHHFMDKRHEIRFRSGIWKFNRKITMEIYSIGLSPFFMNTCACIVVIFINKGLYTYGGDIAVGAYGIINRVLMLIVMVVMGISQGMQPIVGFNYGARQFPRVRQALNYGMIAGTMVTMLGFMAGELAPHAISAMFTDNVELIDFSTTGMRIACLAMPIVGCQIVITNFFQSIGKAKISIFLSLSRQLGFLIPALIVFPKFWGVNGVWMTMPTADVFSCIVTVAMLFWMLRRMRREELNSSFSE